MKRTLLSLLSIFVAAHLFAEDEPLRLLNHWDNLDGTVERGYAGHSIFWGKGRVDSLKIEEYGKYNQSIGINGVVLNNVNASPKMLSEAYLDTVCTYANLLRPYGIKVYLSVNFASPMVLGQLPTADPTDKQVIKWWKTKADQIYRLIPDFGGFLVKANSEGQPGPCDFGRTHAEGANTLAKALKKHGGIVMWRSFVYSPSDPDRAKQAYIEFASLDGKFEKNVIVQIKNGPVDFQPREPISPLFYAMPKTRLMAELQITQEYLGHSNHIVFLGPMWQEFIEYTRAFNQHNGTALQIKDFAGVSNIGDSKNHPCGNLMAEANWYAFGRMAQDPMLTAQAVAKEWIAKTFAKAPKEAQQQLLNMMMRSHEACVDYMMPMGLHHIFAWGHHYGPEPWCAVPGARADWMPSYYHRADAKGLGFDRTEATGSAGTTQYPQPLRDSLESLQLCPEKFLLWFHHAAWDQKIGNTGETLWTRLCHHYQHGLDEVRQMQKEWQAMRPYVDKNKFADIEQRLMTQARDAQWWHDGCILYFQQFSKMPIPDDVEQPVNTLEELMSVSLGITNYECPSRQLLNQKR